MTERLPDQLLSEVVAMFPEALALLDADGRYVLWNESYAELAFCGMGEIAPGTTFRDLLARGVHKGLYPEAAGRERAWIDERLAKQALPRSSHEQRLVDGRWLRLDERRTPSGGLISVCFDITEFKRKQRSFQLLFEANPVPMWLYEAESLAFAEINDAACELFGYERGAFSAMSVLDVMPEDERRALAALRAGAAYDSYAGDRTWTFLRADGGELRLRPYMRAFEQEGRPVRLMALFDVTERERVEAEIRRTQGFLDALIEAVPAMVVVKSVEDHRYILLNKAGEQLLGRPREEILGKSAFDLFPEEEARQVTTRDLQALEPGAGRVISEGPQTTAYGSRHVQATRIPLPGPDGRPDFLVAVVQDLTDQKESAEALLRAKDEAEAANVSKSRFLANMSHEIRTPLNGVIAVADVLAGTELTHSQKEMVGLIRSSGETLSCILADVLDLARIESGKLTLEQHPFNLAEAVRQVAFLLELRAQEKGVELLVEIAPEAETLVMGDVVRVKQVATNLLSNAVKFTERGSVKISVARTVEGFRLTVRDTGVGFDPSVTQDLFKPFQQADGSITRRFGGTGLGLAICRELVDAMGGELDCSGSPGEGAEFTVLLPLIVAAPLIENGSEAAPATEPAATQRALRVLLADDHPTNRKVVELIMAQCGAEVTSVEEGLQAVSAFRQAEFDVVLMDMQMPVCDGLSATRAIRDHERSSAALPCPVIMLTANALPEHIRASVAAGANAHLSKPYTASQLLACIDSVLQNSAAEPDTPERSPVMTMRD